MTLDETSWAKLVVKVQGCPCCTAPAHTAGRSINFWGRQTYCPRRELTTSVYCHCCLPASKLLPLEVKFTGRWGLHKTGYAAATQAQSRSLDAVAAPQKAHPTLRGARPPIRCGRPVVCSLTSHSIPSTVVKGVDTALLLLCFCNGQVVGFFSRGIVCTGGWSIEQRPRAHRDQEAATAVQIGSGIPKSIKQ